MWSTLERLMEQLGKAKAEDMEKFEAILRALGSPTAFTYQPLILPLLEIKPL
jgi:hypothetical protein